MGAYFAGAAYNSVSEQEGTEVVGHVEREENKATMPCGLHFG